MCAQFELAVNIAQSVDNVTELQSGATHVRTV